VESVASQKGVDVEHIVIDGVSTDGTLEELSGLGVRLFSGPDRGIYDAMNKGVRLAQGDIVGILSATDYLAAECVLAKVARTFESSLVDLVHGKVVIVNDRGSRIATVGRDVGFHELRRSMQVAHPSVFVRRDVYERHGLFDTAFRIAGDHEYMLRIWPRVRRHFIDAELVMMPAGGASQVHPSHSLRESMAAAILHGQHPIPSTINYYHSLSRNWMARFVRRSRA
jgi:glycosyltransferase